MVLLSSLTVAAFMGWARIFFAVRRLTGGSSGPQLIRDARNIAITSGFEDDERMAEAILATRVLPPITFGNYLAAFWFELVPMLILGLAIFAVRRFIL